MTTKVLFVLLTLVMVTLCIAAVFYTRTITISAGPLRRRKNIITAAMTSLWLVYVAVISYSGLLQTTALPPRIPLLLILPLFVFIALFLSRRSNATLIDAIPLNWLIYAQVFRVAVELLLHQLSVEGIIPEDATFKGYNYEIVIAATAPLIAAGCIRSGRLIRLPLILWNIAGLTTLAIVVFLFMTHAYAPGIYTNAGPFSIIDFGSFPYTLLPGFLMPLAVFMHILALVKLRRLSGSK